MDYKSVIILTMIMNACHKIDTLLSEVPSDTEVKINDSTNLNCSTSLLANQVQWRHGNNYVYTGIAILEPYNARFSVEINASTGACNLVIRSVQPSDAGTYECADDEGAGDLSSVQLVVLDGDPVCKSNMHSDGVIGPNSCGIEQEEVKLSCSIKFHGNSLPVLQWKASDDNKSITDGRIDTTSNNNEVTYTLTMKSSLGLNNSSFICKTTRTSDKHYNCSSDVINILYVFSSEVTVNMTMNDEVRCFANTSQSCDYTWKWFSGDDISTESDNQNLKPKKGGMHRCEATCPIQNKSCSVQSMHATVHSEEATGTSGQNLMPLLTVFLVGLLALAGIVLVYCWRTQKIRKRRLDKVELQRRDDEVDPQQTLLDEERRRLEEIELQLPEEEERQRREEDERKKLLEVERRRQDEIERQRREAEERLKSLGFIATIRTKAEEEMQKSIQGLAILDNELFVVSDRSSEVEVYDTMEFSFSRQWTLKELIDPWNIVSCHRNNCLYISDLRDSGLSTEIFRVDSSGKLIKKWSTKIVSGRLSVTYDSNVIIAAYRKNKLNEYSSDGQFIREIHLSAEEGFCHPQHAIKLTNGHFVVCHGSKSDGDDSDLHRVCIVDTDGKLLKSFGEKRGSTIRQTHSPVYLSVDGSGSVMVADLYNSRVLLLDSDLEFKKEILTEEHGLGSPYRILLDDSNGRLFVSDNYHNNSQIMIFDISLQRQTI